MKKRYDEIMDKIEVNDEMRGRILENVGKADISPVNRRFGVMKILLPLAACFAVVIAAAVILPNLGSGGIHTVSPAETTVTSPNETTENDVLAIPDIREAASAAELSELVGFEVGDVECLPFSPEKTEYTSYWGEIAEIDYTVGEKSACFRKSAGSEDNSGDYNIYSEEKEITAGEISAILKGESGKYTLAVWSDRGYSYSLSLSDGISAAEWEDIIMKIK